MSAAAPNPITTPRSIDDLSKLASSQIDAEISGQEQPLQQRVTDLQGQETSTLQKIGDMFGTLQPYVSGAASNVQSSYDQAFNASQQIFNTAQQRMAQLKQSRAQEAQAMAQEVGGPVSVGEFTSSVLPAEQELASQAPNSLLHMLGAAEAGTQEANAFSGKVFPLVRSESESSARAGFESQIKDLNSQIDTLEGTKTGKVNDRLNSLLQDERTFQLNQSQQALDKLKANRDWQATVRSLHNDDQRLSMAKKEFALSEAGVTGTYKGKPTLSAIKATIAERQAAQRLNLSSAALEERQRHALETEAIQKQRISNQTQRNSMQILDHAMEPTSRATLTLTKRINIDPKQQPGLYAQALTGKLKDAHRDPSSGQWYYYGKQTITPQEALAQGYNLGGNTPITDPQRLYDLLIGTGTPAPMALKLIRTKTGISDFAPGGTTNYNADTLSGMTNKELAGIAKTRGYKGGGKRQQLVDYILMRNPNSPSLTGLPRP
jgi:hypothetical protein